jgi:hypothetical protein
MFGKLFLVSIRVCQGQCQHPYFLLTGKRRRLIPGKAIYPGLRFYTRQERFFMEIILLSTSSGALDRQELIVILHFFILICLFY